jgi:tetratricopeptide (TPR) repeat protein
VAARIRRRPPAVREAIVTALDEWLTLATHPVLRLREPHLNWLRAVAAAAEPDDKWARQFRAALALQGRAKLRAALKQLARTAEVKRLSPRALTRLALPLEAVGEGARAVALLRRAHRHHPADFWINHHLGWALLHGKPRELAEAVRYYTAAVALRPHSPGAHLNLGHVLETKGRLDEAIACYQKAITLAPKYAGARSNLGNALKAKGRLDEAIACYRKAIALDPKDAGTHYNLGLALKAKGRLDEAIARYRQALGLDPKCALAHCNLGNALKAKGRLNEAIACYRKAFAFNPKYAKAHHNLGFALKAKGRLDEAIAHYRQALALDPKFAQAHENLGVALAAKGRRDEAITCYKKAIALDQKSARAHTFLGFALAAKGRRDEAIASYRQAIALDPKYVVALNNLGVALAAKGRLDEAIACYQKAIALDPKSAQAHTNLGFALAAKGRRDEAIACYKKALALDPKYVTAHTNLGVALKAKGRLGEAIACYKKALALDPKCAKAHGALGEVLLQQGQFLRARRATRRCLRLLRASHPLRLRVERQLLLCRQGLALDRKLAAILQGKAQPTGPTEQLLLAILCRHYKRRYAAAAGFYAAAFAALPRLTENPRTGHRYHAACAAALAAAGQGKDAGKLNNQERARLRGQALRWLRADLKAWANLLASGPAAARSGVGQVIGRWQKNKDLAGIRDETALAKLPAEERQAFVRLWADVRNLLKKAEAPAQEETQR